MRALGGFCVGLAELKIVVVGKFFPRTDVAASLDEDAIIFIFDVAVRRTGVVDPARRIAVPSRINDDFIVDLEQHRVGRVRLLFRITRVSLLMRDAFAGILYKTGFSRNESERKYTMSVNV